MRGQNNRFPGLGGKDVEYSNVSYESVFQSHSRPKTALIGTSRISILYCGTERFLYLHKYRLVSSVTTVVELEFASRQLP